jgi:hypothetical protein
MTTQGVIYYATGTKYVEQMLVSAESLKQHTDLPVTVYSDEQIHSQYIDNVVVITPGEHPFYDRINYFKQTPYDKTLYLDTDTYIAGDVSPIFEMLDRFDVVAAFNESRDTAAPHTKFDTVDLDVPPSFPEYQCGVIGYQNTEPIQQLFDDWQTRYKPYRDKHLIDQPHFREALYNSNLAIGTLPSEYNTLANFGGYLHEYVRLLHYAGSNKKRLGCGTPDADTLQEFVDVLNEDAPKDRVFYYDSARCLQVTPTTQNLTLYHGVVQSVRRDGIWSTIKKTVAKIKQLHSTY